MLVFEGEQSRCILVEGFVDEQKKEEIGFC